MFNTLSLLYIFSAAVWTACASPLTQMQTRTIQGCSKLASTYPKLTFQADSPVYTNESTRFWSETALLTPSCVFTPYSAEDVAGAVKILVATSTQFAVRSGGHMPIAGAASIDKGVLIGMTNLNTLSLVDDKKVAQIGPGQTWGVVYDWISAYGLGVVGGRYGPVGVSGLLLGGGINFFGSRRGWSMNNVVNYQVVLANHSIVNVNATSLPDLFWAIKGGANNFGIVTRFDCQTFPVTNVYGGLVAYDTPSMPKYVEAIANFVAPGGGSEDPDAAIIPSIAITPATKSVTGLAVVFHHGADPNPKSLQDFTSIPAVSGKLEELSSFSSFTDETNIAAFGNRSSRELFWVTSVKSNPQSIKLLNDTLVSMALSGELSHVPGLSLGMSIQPVTTAWLTAAKKSGGDAIDLDPANGPFLSALIYSQWDNVADDETVVNFSKKTVAAINAKSKAAGLFYPFIYLNDAGGTGGYENVFQYYGGGKSLPKMRKIAQKYDPNAVFQNLLPGGFKIGSGH